MTKKKTKKTSKKKVKKTVKVPPKPETGKKKKKVKAKKGVELEDSVFSRDLFVALSNKEMMEKGEELAQCHRDLDVIAAELKDAKDKAKAKSTPIEEQIKELVQAIHSKKERKSVDCKRRWDWTKGIVETIRADTKKVLDSRPITEHERQMKFPEKKDEGKKESEKGGASKKAGAKKKKTKAKVKAVTKAFEEGVKAAKDKKSYESNPYRYETKDHKDWFSGWSSIADKLMRERFKPEDERATS